MDLRWRRRSNLVARTCAFLLLPLGARSLAAAEKQPEEPGPRAQYRHGAIMVPEFAADEPVRAAWSARAANDFLDRGALAWTRSQGCVSCHTTGTYLVTRPALSAVLGPPREEVRNLFVSRLRARQRLSREDFGRVGPKNNGTAAGEVVYLAAGLAEWDRWVTGRLSEETVEALDLMFSIQLDSGAWYNPECWPPFESDSFHLATQAAMAVAAAPNWVERAGPEARAGLAKLRAYLRTTPPPHDYGRVLLLWAASRLPDLLTGEQCRQLVDQIWSRQRADGGWSLRDFAAPEEWGDGSRAARLRAELEFTRPSSDGHQTGLALVVLREAGVSAADPRFQRGLLWLENNQRISGRWWTRSLNTDRWHFIAYSGTAYPLLALALNGRFGTDTPSSILPTARADPVALREADGTP